MCSCQNNLSLCKDVNLGNDILAGKHGATPIINSQSSTTAPRTEMLLEGKFAKRAKSHIRMIEPRSSRSSAARQGFSVARVVVNLTTELCLCVFSMRVLPRLNWLPVRI